jgi:hypothetical protein
MRAVSGPSLPVSVRLGAGAAACVLATSCVAGQPGRLGAVSKSDIPSLKLNHYFTRDGKAHFDVFSWTFTETRFALRPGKGPIADELLNRLLVDKATPKVIEGRWALKDSGRGGQVLELTEIQGDGKPGREQAEYAIYRTGGTVIRLGEPQYVFERRPGAIP